MLPASRAACVPVFIATPTSAWASAGASLVPSPHIATSLPPCCSRRISASLSSGVASARKSSTPASAAMAAAVSGLSPVIITVRMPMRRSSAKRSRTPAFTTSLSATAPSSRPSRTTASGVCPARAISSVARRSSIAATVASRSGCARSTESTAPLWIRPPPKLRPESRVCAVKGIASASAGSVCDRPCFSRARATIERPSGVSSARLASSAASASARSSMPVSGTKALACRSPIVIVPVLSSSSTSQSPAASTARPDLASTLNRTSRSIPAMPIAESSAAIVVGISVMSSAARIATGTAPPA